MQQPQNRLPRTWFILGHEPLLSAAEIFSFLREPKPFNFAPPVLRMENVTEPEKSISQLGGTIKIGTEISANLDEKGLVEAITSELNKIEGKINFGISLYASSNSNLVESWGKSIKKQLKEEGRAVRYVFKREAVLSSVSVEKNDLLKKGAEFLVISSKPGSFSVAKTVAVQPFESFSRRDYGRPGRDDLSGMLPPKLAMMMINLQQNNFEAILDPFCGSGTILSEAMLLGFKTIYGTDLSERAVKDSIKNVEWMKQQFSGKFDDLKIRIQAADVGKLSASFGTGSVGSIVTEPFLGVPRRGNEDATFLEKQAVELSGLYLSAFQEFKKILRPDGRVVFVIPRFYKGHEWISISEKLLPQLKKIGFSADRLLPESIRKEPFVLYRRPGQLVGREIWRFRLD